MKFKKENWQPTIGDKYDLVKFGELTFVRSKQKRSTNFQVNSKPVREYYYDGSIIGETSVKLLKDKQPTYRYGDK